MSSDPKTWLSRARKKCLRCWERWLSSVSCRVVTRVRSIRHERVRCLVALCFHPLLRCHSTVRWYFFVRQNLCFKVHTHTQKNTCMVRECVKKYQTEKGGHHWFFTPCPLTGATCFREIGRMSWSAQVSLQSVRHRIGCETCKSVSVTRQCHSQLSSVLSSAVDHYAC